MSILSNLSGAASMLTGQAGGPQPFQQSTAAQALGLSPSAGKLPGLGTDLVAEADDALKLRQKKLTSSQDPMQSPAAQMLLGGQR